MMKINRLGRVSALSVAALLLAGCAGTPTRNTPIEIWDDMDRQPKFKPQSTNSFFRDNLQAARYPVPGTVARGHLKEDEAFYTGMTDGKYVAYNPVKIDANLLKLGQQRFNTYCSPCHGRTGSGQGIVTVKSGWIASNLYEERVRNFADGDLFDVISHGRRTMPGYRFQVAERDRWAIVAYVRALQRAQNGTMEDVPQELRTELR